MDNRRSYYDVLGVESNATADQIRAAFRRLVMERHPDRFRGEARAAAEKEFQAITEAYNVLIDPSARARYEQQLGRNIREVPSNPKDVAKALLAKAVSYVKLGQFLEAEQYFTQAIAHDRESAKAFYLYGMFLIQQQNRLDQGLRQLDQAVKLDPHDLKILFDSSRLFARGKMAARALRLAQQAVQLAPDDEAAVSWLKELQKTGGRG